MRVEFDNGKHKVYGFTSMFFPSIFAKGDNFRDFLLASVEGKALPKGSTLIGKKLLLGE